MKRNLLLILVLLFQNILFGQDIAKEYFEIVTGLESVDNYELYLAQCDSILEVKPNDFNTRFSKALILGYKNQYELEREEYRSILLFDSTNADIYFNLVASYVNQYKNLVYISKEVDYEQKKSNRRNHWECMGDEKKCMDMAKLTYPLIKRAAQIDTREVDEYPSMKEMESSLREFIEKKK